MVAARRHMIREIVRLDTSSLLTRFANAVPQALVGAPQQRSQGGGWGGGWGADGRRKKARQSGGDAGASGGAAAPLEEPMRDLQRHSSLLQWHVKQNVLPADINTLLLPTLDTYTNTILPVATSLALPRSRRPLSLPKGRSGSGKGGRAGRGNPRDESAVGGAGGTSSSTTTTSSSSFSGAEAASSKAPELKDALLEVSPSFFSLVRQAARKDPSAAPRLYRRVASALTTLLWWNAGRLVRAGPQRQYPLMNAFLEQILVTVTECQGVVGCDGDDECVIQAVERQQDLLAKKTKRGLPRPEMGALQRPGGARPGGAGRKDPTKRAAAKAGGSSKASSSSKAFSGSKAKPAAARPAKAKPAGARPAKAKPATEAAARRASAASARSRKRTSEQEAKKPKLTLKWPGGMPGGGSNDR